MNSTGHPESSQDALFCKAAKISPSRLECPAGGILLVLETDNCTDNPRGTRRTPGSRRDPSAIIAVGPETPADYIIYQEF